MAATAETLRRLAKLRTDLAEVTDKQTRDLVSAWADAWGETSADLQATLAELLTTDGPKITRATLMRSQRLRNALAVIATNLATLAKDAGVRITSDIAGIVDTTGHAQASIIDTQLPPASQHLVNLDAWSRTDDRQIAAIVARSTQQITALHYPLGDAAYQAVRTELLRGVAAGSNPRVTARRMVDRAEGRFNGGLTRALTISRTETLDAYRSAAQLGQQANAQVLRGWTWVSELSTTTCQSCWAMHGTTWPLWQPGPLDHQCGRCTRVPAVLDWGSLGVNLPEPPSLIPDARTRFVALSKEEQLRILGPTRWHAWNAGSYDMDAWSTRRTTPGWRDSFVPSRAPQAAAARTA